MKVIKVTAGDAEGHTTRAQRATPRNPLRGIHSRGGVGEGRRTRLSTLVSGKLSAHQKAVTWHILNTLLLLQTHMKGNYNQCSNLYFIHPKTFLVFYKLCL